MHNDHVTVSTFQLFRMFPDAESARLYLESRRWPQGPRCPVCGLTDRVTARKAGFYRCGQCKEDFTVRTGTIFERSHVPLHKWLYAMYLLVTARKGISSLQLSKEIGITQKSAWFVLGRLREALGSDLKVLQGIVEVDETYIGGKESAKHERKKQKLGRGAVANLHAAIHKHIEIGSMIHSDEHAAYRGLGGLFFGRETVNHSAGEFSRDGVHTNSIESVWAVMKRGVHGVYHQVSRKHLRRYVDEFAFRLNEGNVKVHTFKRLDSMIALVGNRRITYKELTA